MESPTMGTLVKSFLLNLLVCAGTMAGGWAILEYSPGPLPFTILAFIGFVGVWGITMYFVIRPWLPASPFLADPIPTRLSDVNHALKMLSLVALYSVLFALASVSLFLYTPGPLSTDLAVTLTFTVLVASTTWSFLRRKGL